VPFATAAECWSEWGAIGQVLLASLIDQQAKSKFQ
jgi:hypothetical protein